MAERVLFLTGSLAEPRLRRTLEGLGALDFEPVIHNIGIKVAALMTAEIVLRRLKDLQGASRVLLPGRFRGDLDRLSGHFGVPFERGPEDLVDLPQHFGKQGAAPDLSRYETRIFAEIVDAPRLDVAGILDKARRLRAEGADVLDLGCLPDEPFPHLEEAVAALRAEGMEVSVDSGRVEELRRGMRAGAGYLLSLTEETLALAEEGPAVPVLIPARSGDLESLCRAVDRLRAQGRRFLADPILDPIHFGFTASILRYAELRRRYPDIEILMGIGNVTELTDADTTGMNALLMGLVSELRIGHVLAVQVSPHCRRAVREFDVARRQFLAAREAGSLPQGFGAGLLALRDRRPHAATPAEIAELAGQVADPNYRIEVAVDGLHIYNRDGHHVGEDPFALFPRLDLRDDAAHAFYLGAELAKARIAWQLGKRFVQDEELRWGVAVDAEEEDVLAFKPAGATLHAKGEG